MAMSPGRCLLLEGRVRCFIVERVGSGQKERGREKREGERVGKKSKKKMMMKTRVPFLFLQRNSLSLLKKKKKKASPRGNKKRKKRIPETEPKGTYKKIIISASLFRPPLCLFLLLSLSLSLSATSGADSPFPPFPRSPTTVPISARPRRRNEPVDARSS